MLIHAVIILYKCDFYKTLKIKAGYNPIRTDHTRLKYRIVHSDKDTAQWGYS